MNTVLQQIITCLCNFDDVVLWIQFLVIMRKLCNEFHHQVLATYVILLVIYVSWKSHVHKRRNFM